MKVWIKENFNLILSFLVGVLLTSTFFLFQSKRDLEKEIIEVEKPIIKTEIKTITDTIYLTKTISEPQFIKETIIRVDTIKEGVEIPISKKEYITKIDSDSIRGEIYAEISGYNAILDTLSYKLNIPTFTKEITVTEQLTKYKTKHFNFTIGIGGGYGLITRKPDIFIGGMVGYTF